VDLWNWNSGPESLRRRGNLTAVLLDFACLRNRICSHFCDPHAYMWIHAHADVGGNARARKMYARTKPRTSAELSGFVASSAANVLATTDASWRTARAACSTIAIAIAGYGHSLFTALNVLSATSRPIPST